MTGLTKDASDPNDEVSGRPGHATNACLTKDAEPMMPTMPD